MEINLEGMKIEIGGGRALNTYVFSEEELK